MGSGLPVTVDEGQSDERSECTKVEGTVVSRTGVRRTSIPFLFDRTDLDTSRRQSSVRDTGRHGPKPRTDTLD